MNLLIHNIICKKRIKLIKIYSNMFDIVIKKIFWMLNAVLFELSIFKKTEEQKIKSHHFHKILSITAYQAFFVVFF